MDINGIVLKEDPIGKYIANCIEFSVRTKLN